MFLIPTNDTIHLQLLSVSKSAKIVVFVGLPGTGKSLFINHFYQIAKRNDSVATLIQWDVARKEFEKDNLKNIFPTTAGQVHAGVRLSAGDWLLKFIKQWHNKHQDHKEQLLLIEAPLVGNRFSELCHLQADTELEKILKHNSVQFVLPTPNNRVRKKIEEDRSAQISEDAKKWSGAKPSVMRQLWQDTLAIARELGLTTYPGTDYEAKIYKDTYLYILRHRHTLLLEIDKIYEVNINNEESLHSISNEVPISESVNSSVGLINQKYCPAAKMDSKILDWYKT